MPEKKKESKLGNIWAMMLGRSIQKDVVSAICSGENWANFIWPRALKDSSIHKMRIRKTLQKQQGSFLSAWIADGRKIRQLWEIKTSVVPQTGMGSELTLSCTTAITSQEMYIKTCPPNCPTSVDPKKQIQNHFKDKHIQPSRTPLKISSC